MKSRIAVTKSTSHTIGGNGAVKKPMASAIAAMVKARASRIFENWRARWSAPGLAADSPPSAELA